MGKQSLVLHRLKFHHFFIPIAAAMVVIGLAVIEAPRNFGPLEILGPDLVLAIGNVLIVFGAFCIASYVVVRAIEWADQRTGHEEHKEARSKEE
jgi:drug/metabolite transporter (DMT)-like permease